VRHSLGGGSASVDIVPNFIFLLVDFLFLRDKMEGSEHRDLELMPDE